MARLRRARGRPPRAGVPVRRRRHLRARGERPQHGRRRRARRRASWASRYACCRGRAARSWRRPRSRRGSPSWPARSRAPSSSRSRGPSRSAPCSRRWSASTSLIGVGEAVVTVAAVSAVLAARPDLVAGAPPEVARARRARRGGRGVRLRSSSRRGGRRDRPGHGRLALRLLLAGRAAARRGAPRLRRGRSARDAPVPGYAFPAPRRAPGQGLGGFTGTLSSSAPAGGSWRCWAAPDARVVHVTRDRLDRTGLAGDLSSPIHRLDPRAKMIGLLAVTIVAVTTPVALWPVFGACALALAVVALLARVPARRCGGAAGSSCCRWRSSRCRAADGQLGGRCGRRGEGLDRRGRRPAGRDDGVPRVLRGLEALRIPRLMVLIAGLMYRYLFVVRGGRADARRARQPRVPAAPRAAGGRHRPRRGHAVPALLPARRARAPRDAGPRLRRADAGAHPLRLARRTSRSSRSCSLALIPLRLAIA